MKKLLNLFNPKKWAEGFVLKYFAGNGARVAAGCVVGILASPKVAEFLLRFGLDVNLNYEVFENAIAVLLAAIVGGLANTAKHGPLKPEEPK